MQKITINDDNTVKITSEVIEREVPLQSFAELFASSNINFLPDNCCSLGVSDNLGFGRNKKMEPFVVIEQKPRIQTITFADIRKENYRIFVPWTYYRVPFVPRLSANDILTIWSAKKVNDLYDKVFVVPLPTQALHRNSNFFGVTYCNADGGRNVDSYKPIHEQVSEAVSSLISSSHNYPEIALSTTGSSTYNVSVTPEFLIPRDKISQRQRTGDFAYAPIRTRKYLKHYEEITEMNTEEELLKMFQEHGERYGDPYSKFLGKTV